ncbi:protein kinase domain-containing protein [Streptomyces sp. NPDC002125]
MARLGLRPRPAAETVVAETGPLPAGTAARLAAGLPTALTEIHRAGLIHRDLKPSNVLLASDGPRVIDFGIARATDSEGGTEITHTGWLVGSPAYMSPEQAEGRELTPASDVFSRSASTPTTSPAARRTDSGTPGPETSPTASAPLAPQQLAPRGEQRNASLCLFHEPGLGSHCCANAFYSPSEFSTSVRRSRIGNVTGEGSASHS